MHDLKHVTVWFNFNLSTQRNPEMKRGKNYMKEEFHRYLWILSDRFSAVWEVVDPAPFTIELYTENEGYLTLRDFQDIGFVSCVSVLITELKHLTVLTHASHTHANIHRFLPKHWIRSEIQMYRLNDWLCLWVWIGSVCDCVIVFWYVCGFVLPWGFCVVLARICSTHLVLEHKTERIRPSQKYFPRSHTQRRNKAKQKQLEL